ncbi:hypothetical protein QQX98_012565 [Neonectria punicea]|uniref:Uncharacterized protein n=1 Tax=Neonectria punicea TaxID=979145 RepID=A0ABR1GIH5_9HYPO
MGWVMKAGTAVRLGVGPYRLVAIEMGRGIWGLVMNQVEAHIEDNSDEDAEIEVDPMTGEPVDCSGSWNIVWDLQATHRIKIARQHYAVHVRLLGRLQPEMIKTFREISKLWHQFLEGDGKGRGEGTGGGRNKDGSKVAGMKRKAGNAVAEGEVRGRRPASPTAVQQTPRAQSWKAWLRYILISLSSSGEY